MNFGVTVSNARVQKNPQLNSILVFLRGRDTSPRSRIFQGILAPVLKIWICAQNQKIFMVHYGGYTGVDTPGAGVTYTFLTAVNEKKKYLKDHISVIFQPNRLNPEALESCSNALKPITAGKLLSMLSSSFPDI